MSRKRQIWTACRVKKAHFDFWTAIQHCMSLQKEDPTAPIYVYKCDFCEGMHVTRGRQSRLDKKVRKGLAKNMRIMRNPDFWYKADPNVINTIIETEIKLLKHSLGIESLGTKFCLGDDLDETNTAFPDWDD